MAWAQSSTTKMLYFCANDIISGILATNPYKCTTTITFVFFVMHFSKVLAVTILVSLSISAHTTLAPVLAKGMAVAQKVWAGIITSSPLPTLVKIAANSKAAVAEDTAKEFLTPRYSENLLSNSFKYFPCVKGSAVFMAFTTASISAEVYSTDLPDQGILYGLGSCIVAIILLYFYYLAIP